MMNSLVEIENYCKIENPVGALLLTGEWGCGKTYIVEHDLKDCLKDTHIIIRVSLFGILSIEELHKAVKVAYIHSKGVFFDKATGLNKFKSFFEKVSGIIPNNTAKSIVEGVLSFNVLDFVKVENEIDGRKVVLVFDDLERSKLSVPEKLGAINEYCENQKFNVIIVGDEDKLANDDYREIKEKVVQRTIQHVPNYESIVERVIEDVGNPKYRDFLYQKSRDITALFAGTDIDRNSLDKQAKDKLDRYDFSYDKDCQNEKERKIELLNKRPHNIRSLKSAIQDFERIYSILVSKNIADSHRWLFSFLSFSLAAKANLIRKHDSYGMIFGNRDMEILYPGFFNFRFLPDTLSGWVVDGSYSEEALISYIDEQYKSSEASTPKDQVKNNRIDYLEEGIAIQGMKDILQDAYDGNLELNEYVMFICNSQLSRQYALVDLDIDWRRVNDGIRHRIEDSISKGEKREQHTVSISETDSYSEEEKSAYQIIKDARDSSFVMFEANRREYIEAMKTTPYDAFVQISSKRYNGFDNEMADATLEAFENVDNSTKAQIPGYFEGVWFNYRNSIDIGTEGVERSKEGFLRLKNGLQNLCESYSDQPFKKRFTDAFITVIDKLLEDEEEIGKSDS